MKHLAITVVALAGWAAPQSAELPEWVLQLSRIKRHLRQNFERMPNYVCMQRIDRFQTTRRNPAPRHLDTLRLEVAVVGGHESLSRQGAGQIAGSDPGEFIREGSLAVGAYAGTALNLFVYDRARITGWGEEKDGETRLLRFDFEIPQMLRPLKVTHGLSSGWAGEAGSFWVNADTLDVVEVEERATDIPPETGILETSTVIRYARVRIGGSPVLMPARAEMRMTNFDGTHNRNVTEFSACREYGSESRITFETEVPGSTPPDRKK